MASCQYQQLNRNLTCAPRLSWGQAWQRAMCNSKSSQTEDDCHERGREPLPTMVPLAQSSKPDVKGKSVQYVKDQQHVKYPITAFVRCPRFVICAAHM